MRGRRARQGFDLGLFVWHPAALYPRRVLATPLSGSTRAYCRPPRSPPRLPLGRGSPRRDCPGALLRESGASAGELDEQPHPEAGAALVRVLAAEFPCCPGNVEVSP